MKKKILSFITDGNFFLALRNSPFEPKKHGGDFWFVVTGGVEGKESFDEAAKREIREETNLEVKDIFPLNWGSVYEWGGEVCEEHNFISFVDRKKIILNEEHIEYE